MNPLPRLLRALLMWAIRSYQRYISPHKGFGCAYRVHTGRRSCSHLGLRAVRRHGALKGMALLRRRTQVCGDVHRLFHPPAAEGSYRRLQRGSCDLPCDLPCDVGGCDGPNMKLGQWGDACQCCDCSWDRSDKKRAKERERRGREAVHPSKG